VRKYLVIAVAVISIMLASFGLSQAATSALDNLPGGAGVGYWDCTGGTIDLISISNVASAACGNTAVMVHIIFYDKDSNKLRNFSIPLSAINDTWTALLSCSGNNITIAPTLPQGGQWPAGNKGETTVIFGNGGSTTGYFTAMVSAVDDTAAGGAGICGAIWGGNGDGDPRNDIVPVNANIVLPNVLYGRVAYMSLNANTAWATNLWMMQDYYNMTSLNEAAFGTFFDSIFDFWCPGALIDWNGNGSFVDNLAGADDVTGLTMDQFELYITDNFLGSIVADLCQRAGRQRAFGAGYDVSGGGAGAAAGVYWGRYNANVNAQTSSSLIAVFPAASTELSNNCAAHANDIITFSFDDEEHPYSDQVCPKEAAPLTLGQGAGFDIDVNYPFGEIKILSQVPMMGYIFTAGPNYADIYPLIRENAAIYPLNFTFYPYIFGLSEVYFVGNN
jgi:hypothetical protein